MASVQQVLDDARVSLNDADKERYPDATMLFRFLVAGVALAHSLRPDLRFPNYATPPAVPTLGGTFPLPASFEPAIQHYIIARAQTTDDEHSVAGLPDKQMAIFTALVTNA